MVIVQDPIVQDYESSPENKRASVRDDWFEGMLQAETLKVFDKRALKLLPVKLVELIIAQDNILHRPVARVIGDNENSMHDRMAARGYEAEAPCG